MKKLIMCLVIISVSFVILAQAPERMSYQAVMRNTIGALVTNQSVGMRISILQGSATGTPAYVETQTPTTNANGLASLEIGGGAVVTGTFAGIDWSTGPYFIKTETDPAGGTNYTIVGTSQLLSVPYALYSKTSETSSNAVTIAGDQTIGGIKIFSNDLKINGITVGRGKSNVYSNMAIGTNALFSNTTGYGSIAFGNAALYNNTTGYFNIAIGNYALQSNTTGVSNVSIGFSALSSNTTGYYNTANGMYALSANTNGHDNTAIGFSALTSNHTGASNTASGVNALYSNTNGQSNTAVGSQAGYNNLTGNNNVFLGYEAGYFETGSNKLFIDNQRRTDESDARIKSLIYGVFDANPANQSLIINGNVGIGINSPSYPFTVLTGNNLGIYAESTSSSTSGIGIKGYSSSATSTGKTYGVMGESASYRGNGVYGYASSSTGTTIGVFGQSASPSGFGIYGLAPSSTGNSYGAYGESVSSSGHGVQGYASSASGETYGVWGLSNSTSGIGVFGDAASATGTTYGVKGNVASPQGYSGYFTGGKFYIGGQVQITGGAPAMGKVLTSDGTGLATWEPPAGNSSHYIGESYGGGIVFYVYDNGRHGLIAATSDQSTGVVWTTTAFLSTFSNAVRDGINGGLANTEHSILQAGAGSYAAQLCANYKGGSYADWYLPSRIELNFLYLQKDVVGGFASSDYWSSTENNYGSAWREYFTDGVESTTSKSINLHVRAVRAF